jgi:hypothetical protein
VAAGVVQLIALLILASLWPKAATLMMEFGVIPVVPVVSQNPDFLTLTEKPLNFL